MGYGNEAGFFSGFIGNRIAKRHRVNVRHDCDGSADGAGRGAKTGTNEWMGRPVDVWKHEQLGGEFWVWNEVMLRHIISEVDGQGNPTGSIASKEEAIFIEENPVFRAGMFMVPGDVVIAENSPQ